MFNNADGSYTAELSAAPINYKDKSGKWQEIQARFTQEADGSFTNLENNLKSKFSAESEDGGVSRTVRDRRQETRDKRQETTRTLIVFSSLQSLVSETQTILFLLRL